MNQKEHVLKTLKIQSIQILAIISQKRVRYFTR